MIQAFELFYFFWYINEIVFTLICFMDMVFFFILTVCMFICLYFYYVKCLLHCYYYFFKLQGGLHVVDTFWSYVSTESMNVDSFNSLSHTHHRGEEVRRVMTPAPPP